MKFSKKAKATLATAALIAAISGSMLAGGEIESTNLVIQPQPVQVVKADVGPVFRTKQGLHEIAKDVEDKIEVASIKIDVEKEEEEVVEEEPKLSNEEVADLVMLGRYGNGGERRNLVEGEGYNYDEIQEIVESKSPKPVVSKPVQTAVTSSASAPSEPSAPAKTNGNVINAFPHNTFKSYMRWTILSTSSPQGKLAAKATADPSTAIMKYNGRYLVALGFAYAGNIGEHIDIVMESGQVIPAIVGDWKAKEHTDANNSSSLNNGSIVEFIVSSNEAAGRAINGSGNYNTIFPGRVSHFVK